MLRRIEAANPDPVAALVSDAELETPLLPRDLPRWAKDMLAISARTRALLANLKPIAVRIFTFWDHHVRSIVVAGRRLSIDISSSYRLD